MTVRLIGTDTIGVTPLNDIRAWYFPFTALETGIVSEIKVYSLANGNVKVAIYADDAGAPGDKITGNDDSQAVTADQWNTLSIGDTPITKDVVYWLAVLQDGNGRLSWYALITGLRYSDLVNFAAYTWPAVADDTGGADADIAVAGWGELAAAGRSFGFIIG